eukprot:5372499-Prymnesium_polylepis.2
MKPMRKEMPMTSRDIERRGWPQRPCARRARWTRCVDTGQVVQGLSRSHLGTGRHRGDAFDVELGGRKRQGATVIAHAAAHLGNTSKELPPSICPNHGFSRESRVHAPPPGHIVVYHCIDPRLALHGPTAWHALSRYSREDRREVGWLEGVQGVKPGPPGPDHRT